MKTDSAPGRRLGRRREQGQKLLIQVTQRRVVDKERLVNFSEALENGGVSCKLFTDFHESPNNKDAHPHRIGAVQDIGDLQRAVFGKGVWTIATPTM